MAIQASIGNIQINVAKAARAARSVTTTSDQALPPNLRRAEASSYLRQQYGITLTSSTPSAARTVAQLAGPGGDKC
jgi:hypothetical protein